MAAPITALQSQTPRRIFHVVVGETFHFKIMSRRPLVVRVTDPFRSRSATYVVTQLHTGERVCTCSHFAQDRSGCPHTAALDRHTKEEINFAERMADRRAAELYEAGLGIKAALNEAAQDWKAG